MNAGERKRIHARFWRQPGTGKEPVRDWLLDLDRGDRVTVGTDIRTCEYGWPIGMPVCRPLGDGVYEVRSDLPGGRISRVLFCISGQEMILLHAFIKKTRQTPPQDLELAKKRRKNLHGKEDH